jgi:hypothetical protein
MAATVFSYPYMAAPSFTNLPRQVSVGALPNNTQYYSDSAFSNATLSSGPVEQFHRFTYIRDYAWRGGFTGTLASCATLTFAANLSTAWQSIQSVLGQAQAAGLNLVQVSMTGLSANASACSGPNNTFVNQAGYSNNTFLYILGYLPIWRLPCSTTSWLNTPCANGGQCITALDGQAYCQCPSGISGEKCQYNGAYWQEVDYVDAPASSFTNNGTRFNVSGSAAPALESSLGIAQSASMDMAYFPVIANLPFWYGRSSVNPSAALSMSVSNQMFRAFRFSNLSTAMVASTCSGVNCQNGGTCVNGACVCPADIYGANCQINCNYGPDATCTSMVDFRLDISGVPWIDFISRMLWVGPGGVWSWLASEATTMGPFIMIQDDLAYIWESTPPSTSQNARIFLLAGQLVYIDFFGNVLWQGASSGQPFVSSTGPWVVTLNLATLYIANAATPALAFTMNGPPSSLTTEENPVCQFTGANWISTDSFYASSLSTFGVLSGTTNSGSLIWTSNAGQLSTAYIDAEFCLSSAGALTVEGYWGNIVNAAYPGPSLVNPPYTLALQSSGALSVFDASSTRTWTTGWNTMYSNDSLANTLLPGNVLYSPSRSAYAQIVANSSFAIFNATTSVKLWSTRNYTSVQQIVIGTNGYLSMWNTTSIVWTSAQSGQTSSGTGPWQFQLMNNGNATVTDSTSKVLWNV